MTPELASTRDVSAMQWRSCVGFPDYEVSECGDVRRVKVHVPARMVGSCVGLWIRTAISGTRCSTLVASNFRSQATV